MFAETATLAPAALALYAGHHAGDYLLQSDHQAMTKGRCSHDGRVACAGHVATLTLAQALMLALALGLTGTAVEPIGLAIGLAINAISHYWADRRATLRGLVLATERWTQKTQYYDEFGGAAHMDQAWHQIWIVPAALAIAAPTGLALAIGAGAAGLLATAALASRHGRRTEQRAAA